MKANTNNDHQLTFKVEKFEGPLDLLLHLIRQNKMNINDIPMAEITAQYIDYLHQMQTLQLDVAGEYLVMAAMLLNIKSKMLLPTEQEQAEDGIRDPAPVVTGVQTCALPILPDLLGCLSWMAGLSKERS